MRLAVLYFCCVFWSLHAQIVSGTANAGGVNYYYDSGTVNNGAGTTATYNTYWTVASQGSTVIFVPNSSVRDSHGNTGSVAFGWTGTASAGANAGQNIGLAPGTYNVTNGIITGYLGTGTGPQGGWIGSTKTVVVSLVKTTTFGPLPVSSVPVYWVWTDQSGNVIQTFGQMPGTSPVVAVQSQNGTTSSDSITCKSYYVDPSNLNETGTWAYNFGTSSWQFLDSGPINPDGSVVTGSQQASTAVTINTQSEGEPSNPNAVASNVVPVSNQVTATNGTTTVSLQSSTATTVTPQTTVPSSGTALDTATATNLNNSLVNAIATGNAAIVDAIAKQGANSSGGGGTDNAGIESRQDTGNGHLGSIDTKMTDVQTLAVAANTAKAANPTTSAMQSAGASEAATESASVPSYTPPTTTPTTATPTFTIHMPAAFGGATVDFNPFESGRLNNVAAGIRAATLWLVLVLYGIDCWKVLTVYITGVGSVRQAEGNSVAAGTGAQATALVAAGLISVAIVVALTGLFALLADIGFGSVASIFTASQPWASMPAQAVWMLDQVVPVSAVSLSLVGRIIFRASAGKIFLVCAAVVRYIVP